MARILRGEIYWADLNPVRGSEQGGLRPVLILNCYSRSPYQPGAARRLSTDP